MYTNTFPLRPTSSLHNIVPYFGSSVGLMSPKHHTYNLATIGLSLDLLNKGLSNRGVEKALQAFSLYINDLQTIPSYNTIRDWGAKRGNYLFTSSMESSCFATEWCLIVDISISIGAQRVLLALGVDLSKYDHSLPLRLCDVKVLAVGCRTLEGWTAQAIVGFLTEHVLANYQVAYMVSDSGPNIKRAALDLGLERVDDISHSVANSLKHCYTQLSDFELFMKKCIHLRRYNGFNNFYDLRPPMVRSKSRFMNVRKLIYWAEQMLLLLDGAYSSRYGRRKLSSKDRGKLEWLRQMRPMINLMSRELRLIDTITRALKAQGVQKSTISWAKELLANALARKSMHAKVGADLSRYLDDQLAILKRLNRKVVICSTDVIESCFGKYKAERPVGQRINFHTFRIFAYPEEAMDAAQIKEMAEINTMKEVRQRIRAVIKLKPTNTS